MRYKSKPWDHQQQAYDFLKESLAEKPGAALFMDMGTGKSKVAIDFINNLEDPRLVVIFCPKAVSGVWGREFGKHACDDWAEINFCSLTPAKKEKKCREADQLLAEDKRVYCVCNYESSYREPLKKWFMKHQTDFLILDESHKIKSPSGKASRWISRYAAKKTDKRVIMTGTPLPHSPEDLYAQFRAMNPDIFGWKVTPFRNKYSYQWGDYSSQRTWYIKPNESDYTKKMDENSFVVKASDVLDLPEVLHQDIPITLPAKAQKKYGQMEEDFITEFESGEFAVASTKLVALLRLQQMTGGFLADEYLHSEKIDAVSEIVEEAGEPVVIFTTFTAEIMKMKEELSKKFRVKILNGKYKELGVGATYPPDTDVLICQIAAGGSGIDLTGARICIYFSVGYNRGDYDQSLARVHRPGQEKKVMYYHLIAPGTVDEYIQKNLDKKGDMAEQVISSILNR